MSAADIYRQRSDNLLREASQTANLGERSRLISEAVHWRMMADTDDAPHDENEGLGPLRVQPTDDP